MNSSSLITSEQILAVGQKLLELRPLDDVLDSVLEAAMGTIRAETGLILFRDEAGNLKVVAERSTRDSRGLEQISSSLLEEAFQKREPVLTESAVADPRFSGKSSIMLQRIEAAVIVPLIRKDNIIGAIYLDSRTDRTQFHRDNLAPLGALAAFSTLAIENARRYESARGSASKLSSSLLIGSAQAMQELFAMIERVAASDLTALILGESGTGKELVAREIHNKSARKDKPFMALYCGNVSPQLFESELFGHKKGSFTGATSDKLGLVEAAKGGTLFLDEVADIPADVQTKLLRFLQEGEYRAVGDTVTKKADVRVICATNKDLKREADAGRFRSDLYFRLFILPVKTPTLRDRLSDIPHLVRHFLEKHGTENASKAISQSALRRLMNYTWPGNVRELEHCIARAVVVTQNDRIEADDIWLPEQETLNADDWSWKAAEKKHILHVLSVCNGNKKKAAEMLGISRRYLHYKLKEWGEGEG